VSKIPPEELESVAALRVAIRRFLAATDDVTDAYGLTPRQYDLLALLHRPGQGREVTASLIAEELSLSRSATTELLTRAVKAGLMVRDTDREDMRVKHLSPTREGTRRFSAAVKELRTERNRILTLLRAAAALAATVITF
jgi:DNA-binding MarR family transcriptional regulator